MPPAEDMSTLLTAARRGDRHAAEELFPVLYRELRQAARGILRGWSPSHTMNSAALVNEAYLKLVGNAKLEVQDRHHFLALAAGAMRQIMVDYARARMTKKRGAGAPTVALDESRIAADRRSLEILSLDLALEALAQRSERLARLVELRFFAGLSSEDAAGVLEISKRTAMRDWRKARAFLSTQLRGDSASVVADAAELPQ